MTTYYLCTEFFHSVLPEHVRTFDFSMNKTLMTYVIILTKPILASISRMTIGEEQSNSVYANN